MIRTARLQAGATLAGLLLVSALVVQTSSAAFSASTSSGGNSWTAGTVTLADNDAGAAMFTITNMKPGDTVTRCIKLTYSGTLDSAVKLYGAVAGGTGLGSYLDLTVESGTDGGAFSDCTGFVSGATIFTNTVANFASTHTSWANGLADANWTPSTSSTERTYRFSVTLQDDNAAQGLTATTTTFTWETQNT